jgi:hypothetical protein
MVKLSSCAADVTQTCDILNNIHKNQFENEHHSVNYIYQRTVPRKKCQTIQFSIRPILTAALHKRSVSTVLCLPQVLEKNMHKVMFLAYFNKNSLHY